MIDIVVTTPYHESENSASEARQCIEDGGGFYFRRVPFIPKGAGVGSRLFYVERGFITGYAVVCEIANLRHGEEPTCATTGRTWPPGFYLIADATTWKWIHPILMRGFQGVRRLHPGCGFGIVEVGGWKDPRPKTPARLKWNGLFPSHVNCR